MMPASLPSAEFPKVAILAGGLATRLGSMTERLPKSLVPVAGRPFLAHQLDQLRAQGVRRAVLCVGHLSDQIEAVFREGREFGVALEYSHDGPELTGTAGALRRALPLLGPNFFTLYGDSYLEVDYRAIWSAYRKQEAPALMTVISRELATEPANVWYEAGRVCAYDKKKPTSPMRHVDYGLGLFSAQVFEGELGEFADLSDVQSRLAATGRLAGHEVAQRYFEIGSPRGLAELESHVRARSLPS